MGGGGGGVGMVWCGGNGVDVGEWCGCGGMVCVCVVWREYSCDYCSTRALNRCCDV